MQYEKQEMQIYYKHQRWRSKNVYIYMEWECT